MKRNLIPILFVSLMLVFVATSCKEDCEKDSTGSLVVQNQSATSTSYAVVVDGTNEGTVAPGSEGTYELSTGSHSVQILNSTDNTEACTTTSVNIVECEKSILSCNF
ncbi:MAG: hypothetical protein V2A54_13755 [Bacteroidota bacterium]